MCPGSPGRDHRPVVRTRALRRSEFVRPEQGRIGAGVAAGLADTFGLNANVVRCGFVVLSVASGFGILLYGAAWALMPPADPERERPLRTEGADPISTLAFAAIVVGGLLFVRAFGLWPGDVIVWPLAAALVGLALLAMNGPAAETDSADLPDWTVLQKLPPDAADAVSVLLGTRRGALARIIAGGLCMLTGVIAFVATVDSWSALRSALLATFAVVVGLALVIGPGVMRLAHAFVTERQERVRADERADVAAHLHDSVLQTLALVQRRADDPREVVRLARLQERELRAWLLRGDAPAANTSSSLGAALEEMAADVETETGVPVEVVRVRDCGVDGTEPLLLAAREAIFNAARHSGAPNVSVYLEVEADTATIFVRDRGKGFDTDAVPADRGGINYSITGRMERAGGKALIRSVLEEGTEVELVLPRVHTEVETT
jgi:signal transduction histidine kinase/phage shock protein PspC (stress-responsive transcriptional regulator)